MRTRLNEGIKHMLLAKPLSRRHHPRQGWWSQRHHNEVTGQPHYRTQRRYARVEASRGRISR